MPPYILIFICQFGVVYMLGVQSLNVRDGHYIGAAISSLLIGIFAFITTSIIGGLNVTDLGSVVGLSFLVAGPLGITAAMASHEWLVRVFRRL
jgi:hypothetical protein